MLVKNVILEEKGLVLKQNCLLKNLGWLAFIAASTFLTVSLHLWLFLYFSIIIYSNLIKNKK